MTEPAKEREIKLPNSDKDVFTRLTVTKGTLPDVPFVGFLFPPNSTTDGTKIPDPGDAELETTYGLGRSANALDRYRFLCEGEVLFKEKDTVGLRCEFFVDGEKLQDSADVELSGTADEVKPFQFRCKFVH